VFLGKEPLRIEILQERIRQLMEASADKKVYLQADRRVVYDDIVKVIDVMKAAGVVDVGLVTDLPPQR
jgi:biopolymer transport protein ExbD